MYGSLEMLWEADAGKQIAWFVNSRRRKEHLSYSRDGEKSTYFRPEHSYSAFDSCDINQLTTVSIYWMTTNTDVTPTPRSAATIPHWIRSIDRGIGWDK